MPHIIVKLRAGRSVEEKSQLAEALAKATMATLGSEEFTISVGIEDIQKDDWIGEVYRPDILGKSKTIFKQPGYTP